MVVRCPGCQTGYRLDVARVPETGVRVRCPRCAHVFRLRAPAPMPAPLEARPPAAPERTAPATDEFQGIERERDRPPLSKPVSSFGSAPGPRRPSPAPLPPALPPRPSWQSQERTLDLGTAPAKPAPRLETAPFRPDAAAPVATQSAQRGAPSAPSGSAPAAPGSAAHERARRLARVLVSDILVYNQAVRDRAQGEGNLATALGPEITKAWELYKSKVSPEVVASTTYFKDALNEILAGGGKIF